MDWISNVLTSLILSYLQQKPRVDWTDSSCNESDSSETVSDTGKPCNISNGFSEESVSHSKSQTLKDLISGLEMEEEVKQESAEVTGLAPYGFAQISGLSPSERTAQGDGREI